MTPEERVHVIEEKIVYCFEPADAAIIAAEIRAAVAEARGNIDGHSLRSDVWEAAKAEAYADAAWIADTWKWGSAIAKQIRARAKELQ